MKKKVFIMLSSSQKPCKIISALLLSIISICFASETNEPEYNLISFSPGPLPATGKAGSGSAGRWQRLFFEDFEGQWPGQWSSVDQDEYNGRDSWAVVTCGPPPVSGIHSCWCSGSGDMTQCGDYDSYQDSWLTYGPFSLEDCIAAKVLFNISIDSEESFDTVTWAVSTDGVNFAGYSKSGAFADWSQIEYDMTRSGSYGNVCGLKKVWFAFNFKSDYEKAFAGVYLDDIEILIDKGDPAADLEPHRADGWDGTIVISTEQNTTTSSTDIYEDQNIYVDYSCINTGTADAGAFSFGIWVDNVKVNSFNLSGLAINSYSNVNDIEIGPLSAGDHNITIKCDYNSEVAENDENNNQYTLNFSIREKEPDAEIHGFIWNDANSNGIWDNNEKPLNNWQVYLDLNENCQLNDDEPVFITGQDGAYSFTALHKGTYSVAIVQQSYCTQTLPGTVGESELHTYFSKLTDVERASIAFMVQDSPPTPPAMLSRAMARLSSSTVMLSNVPTSTWTYGCSPTAAGMLFGYYDRTEYPNMYTGPANGGLCPLSDLGQGINAPIAGACSIIATQKGFDGRTSNGHVDDYWIGFEQSGPDPWKKQETEHAWGDCTADYMGTSQWKWDFENDGSVSSNIDGATTYYYNTSGSKLYDPILDESYGLPQTTLCHGMRLFAESRGYTVLANYNQQTDNMNTNGFSLADFKSEIDNARPVLIHVEGHTMIGVGYDKKTETVYLHDTWDNNVHSMAWGGEYAGMGLRAVTVFQLDESTQCAGTHLVDLDASQTVYNISFGNNCPSCGRWGYMTSDLNQDCFVNLEDLSIMLLQWLECTHPDYDDCIRL